MSGKFGQVAIPIAAGLVGFGIGGAIAKAAFWGAKGTALAGSIGFMVGSFVGQMIAPKPSMTHRMPQMAGYPIQQSAKGSPLPVVYGTVKTAGNIIWLGDLESYVVVHKQSGGKGGGGTSKTEEVRYKRSFLIAICHGPANVVRLWKGKDEVDLNEATYYDGLNNSGIRTLTGEDYGDYKHVCCAYFEDYELGNSAQLPNFTFEVRSGTVGFFLGAGYLYSTWGVAKVDGTGALDGTWGFSGRTWNLTQDSTTQAACQSSIDGSVYVINGHQDAKGDLYRSHIFDNGTGTVNIGDILTGSINGNQVEVVDVYYWTDYPVDGSYAGMVAWKAVDGLPGDKVSNNEDLSNGTGGVIKVSASPENTGWRWIHKFDKDGKLDTSWGQHGRKYVNAVSIAYALKEDSQGNLYYGVVGGRHGKLDADGQWVWMTTYNSTDSESIYYCMAIELSEDEKYVYMFGHQGGLAGFTGVEHDYNGMKLNAATGVLVSGWGNNGDGRFMSSTDRYGLGQERDILDIQRIPGTEKLWGVQNGAEINGTRYSLVQINESGNYASVGNNGELLNLTQCMGRCQLDVDNAGRAWVLCYPCSSSGIMTETAVDVYCVDVDGTILYEFTVSGSGTGWANGILVSGGYVYLTSGSTEVQGGITACVHRYTYEGNVDTDWPDTSMRSVAFPYEVEWIFKNQQFQSEDVNPAWVIYDYMTNYRYGGGVPTSMMDLNSFRESANYFDEHGLLFSFLFAQTQSLKDAIDYILSHCFGYITMVDGKYKLGVYKDEAAARDLTRDHIQIIDANDIEPPIRVTKRKYSETFNRIEITWTDRDNNYDTSVVTVMDEVDIRVSGTTRKKTLQLLGITNETVAIKVAWRMLYDALYRFSNYSVPTGFKLMFLYPGQVISLNDGFRILDERIRITGVTQEERSASVTLDCIEDQAYLYPIFSYRTDRTRHSVQSSPTLVSPLVVFRESMDQSLLHLSIIPQGTETNGWFIYRSFDDVSYEYMGAAGIDGVDTANAHGTLDTDIPAYITGPLYRPDDVIDVTLDSGKGLGLVSASDEEFWSYKKLARIGDEIIAYRDATNVSGDQWRLKGIIRGLFYTTPEAHSTTDDFYTLNIDFTYIYEPTDIGRTIYFKLATFYGDNVQDLEDVSSVSRVISGQYQIPGAISNLRILNREGHVTITGYPIQMDMNFTNWDSGLGRSPFGNCVWSRGSKDESINDIRIQLKETDGTKILDETHSLDGYEADQYRLTLEDVDRDGNDPIDVFVSAIASTSGPERNHRVNII